MYFPKDREKEIETTNLDWFQVARIY